MTESDAGRPEGDGRPLVLAIVKRDAPFWEGLKEIEGIGEAFCRDYGAEVLVLMPDVTAPAPEKEAPPKMMLSDESWL